MPLEEALLKMQSSSKYQELILRIKKYCDNKKIFNPVDIILSKT